MPQHSLLSQALVAVSHLHPSPVGIVQPNFQVHWLFHQETGNYRSWHVCLEIHLNTQNCFVFVDAGVAYGLPLESLLRFAPWHATMLFRVLSLALLIGGIFHSCLVLAAFVDHETEPMHLRFVDVSLPTLVLRSADPLSRPNGLAGTWWIIGVRIWKVWTGCNMWRVVGWMR